MKELDLDFLDQLSPVQRQTAKRPDSRKIHHIQETEMDEKEFGEKLEELDVLLTPT